MDQGREDHPKGGILCKKELGQIQARPKLQSAPVLGGGGGGSLWKSNGGLQREQLTSCSQSAVFDLGKFSLNLTSRGACAT